ncbi:MAG: hypothetical protein GF399_09985 [Candidatus Coatesbacteria bacterium]|nr:hypothetical protein [Candidatus Coatesbacteria bacterium]
MRQRLVLCFVLLLSVVMSAEETELYWDDGEFYGAVSETGCWAVEFEKPSEEGSLTQVGLFTWAVWRERGFDGELRVYSSSGGAPGQLLDSRACEAAGEGYWQWVDVAVEVPTQYFYVAWYDGENAFYLGRDVAASGHSWHRPVGGDWGQTDAYGDLMLRCRWDDNPIGVTGGSWGAVKALYR